MDCTRENIRRLRIYDYEKDKNPEHWRTINHAPVHLDETNKIDGGAVGKFNQRYFWGPGWREKNRLVTSLASALKNGTRGKSNAQETKEAEKSDIIKRTETGQEAYKYMKDMVQSRNIIYNPVKKNEKDLTDDEIIEKVAGGDLTDKGSCASAALAYIANKCGFDTRDFRGGDSQKLFSKYSTYLDGIIKLDGIKTQEHDTVNEAGETAKILQTIELNKEFMLMAGRHAAIVRRTEEKGLELLELQREEKDKNGWIPFKNGEYGKTVIQTLKERFDCRNSKYIRVAGMKIPVINRVVLMEVDSFKDCKDFEEVAGWFNTNEGEQKKGAGGYAK